MSDAKEIVETIDGCKVSMLRGGKGEPMLFLHGAGGAGVWLPFMKKMAEKFDVIVPEHPGFGKTDSPEWLDNVGDVAYFYLDLIEKLGLRNIHLVGTSLGGWIAAEIAVRNTSRLRTVTLIAPAGIHVKGVAKGDIFLWTPEQRIRNLFVDQKIADFILGQPVSDDLRKIQVRNALTTAQLAWHPRFYNPDLRKWLHRINVPTQIIWGDSDKIFPKEYGPAYRDLIPGSNLQIIENCGHVPHVEKMDTTVTMMTKFIEGAKVAP